MKNRVLRLLLAFAVCMMVIPGCVNAKSATVKKATIKRKTKLYFVPGQVRSFKIKGAVKPVTWRSKNPAVASVTNNSVVMAVKPGKTTVYAKYKGKKYICKVYVMSLNNTSVSIKKGGYRQLKVINGGSKIKWKSSDKAVAKVSKGKVKAVGPGIATITARARGKYFKCKVFVPSVSLSTTKLMAPSTISGAPAGSASLAYIYTRNFQTTPTFSSSNNSVATVNENGTIQALKKGSAVITIAADGVSFPVTIVVENRPVNVFLACLSKYSDYIKANPKYFGRSESSPTETFADAQALVAKKSKAKINCRAGVCWAFYEMGITTGANDTNHTIWAKNGSFAGKFTGNPAVPTNVNNYMTRITQGAVIGKTVKDAVNAGLLKPGDICCFKGRTHTFTYSGKGYKFFDGGKIVEMTGYGKIGFLMDFSKGYSKKYGNFDSDKKVISEVLRWK